VNERGFRRNDRVRLIHAPSYQRNTPGDSVGFYSEDHVIRRVRRNQNPDIPAAFEIELENGILGSFKTDATVAGTPLGDAIVNLSNGDPFFHMDEQYVTGAFAEAFVDVVKVTNGVGMPLYQSMTNETMVFAGAKWWFLRETTLPPPNFRPGRRRGHTRTAASATWRGTGAAVARHDRWPLLLRLAAEHR
jgi:hypothetical protein